MKVYLRTFGCRANHYDSEAVRELIERGGHELVGSAASADVAVFNSCAVTAAAEIELRKSIRGAARQRPGVRSIVMGCASALEHTRAPANRLGALPTVAHVVPGADLEAVAAALGVRHDAATVRTQRQTTTRAVLRIQDGCDEHCTFCATTMARGANRSRPVETLVREAALLADHHPEIVLTGIHIGSYGADIGSSLGQLVERLIAAFPAVRFRLSSLEATEVDDRLLHLFASAPAHLVPHLHAPLQSASDGVLRRMGRHWYTARSYATAVERLVDATATFGLGADVIAGFPGETEDDHAATLAFVERLPFTYLHVFPYSVRPGTPAERLGSHVPQTVIDRRARELRAVGEQKAASYAARRAAGLADVVVIGPPRSLGEREALTGDYLTVQPGDPTLPRGARFTARLSHVQGRLFAHRAES